MRCLNSRFWMHVKVDRMQYPDVWLHMKYPRTVKDERKEKGENRPEVTFASKFPRNSLNKNRRRFLGILHKQSHGTQTTRHVMIAP